MLRYLRCVLSCVVVLCCLACVWCGGRWEEGGGEVLAVSGKNKNPNLRSWGIKKTLTQEGCYETFTILYEEFMDIKEIL